MNIAEWVERVAAQLRQAGLHYGHGTESPEDEAAWLVLEATGLAPDAVPGAGNREVGPEQRERIESLLSERIERGIPLAYLTGHAWFAGLEFEVDKSVLIPRSPIAELIIEQFSPWRRPEEIGTVLDLCTGSGAIGIATAVHMPWVRVDATDISAAALAVARRNVQRHGVSPRVALYRSDFFDALEGRRYDLIVTNPPYLPAAGVAQLPREFRAEPELALASGLDGLDACLRIMLQSALHLEDQGILICEVGESDERLAALLPTVPFLWLEFSRGGSGVFLLERDELIRAQAAMARCSEEREHV
jgi:ribosomal protein L3 glutamine methyltransferase